MKNTKNNMMREMVSGENGIVSSKRVMGIITLVVCLICVGWLVWAEGGTQVVENLLQTLMIMAAALLGISSITGIWRKGPEKTIKQEDLIDDKFDPENPCKNCIHNTKKATE